MSKMVYAITDLNNLPKGEYRLFTKTLSDTDAMLYAGISGEMSPSYLNEEFSSKTVLKTRTVSPMLVASIASGAIFRLLPPATRPISRNFSFVAPVFAGDTITALAEVSEVFPEMNEVTVEVICYNQKEEKVLEGICREVIILPEE